MLNIILIIVKLLQYIIPGAFIIVKNKFNRYLFCTKIKWVWTVYAIFINSFMKRKLFQPILFLQKLGSYSIHIFAINCRLKRFFDLKNAINCTQFVHKVKQIDTVLTVVLEWQRHHSLYDRNFFFHTGLWRLPTAMWRKSLVGILYNMTSWSTWMSRSTFHLRSLRECIVMLKVN